ncbi:NAC domain-containing protein 78-like [Magnolia sinica]|uniref:NAC domain-containing protein 78-like n=1 Tax=Magnolia sinica TaxID=86752 RepID=UPI00265AB737|nr:NAC domain-containing protein 78-like [Magnolia sinica]
MCNLELKNRGVDNPSDVIDVYDIYNRRPDLLPRDSWIGKEDELFYYVKPKLKESSIDRSVENGYGCWKSTGEVEAIKHKDLVIGYKHTFNFRIGRNRRETNWMMEEYRLASQSSSMDLKRLVEGGKCTKATEFFLCKIYERSSEETLTRSKRTKTGEMNGSWDISAEDL